MRKKNLSAEAKCARNSVCGIRAIFLVNENFPLLFPRFSMKIISWNVRGLNGLTKKRMMKRKIQQDKLVVLFIQETKCSSETLQMFMEKIWKGCKTTAIDAKGTKGEVAIAWNLAIIYLRDSSACAHAISASFHILGSNIHGHLLNIYSPQPLELKL